NLLADIKNCDVLHSSIGTRIAALHDLIKNLDQFDQIPQIEVARGDDETALVFRHLLSLPDQDIEKLREFGKKYQFHIYLQPTLPALVHKIWPEDNNNRLSYSLSDYSLTMQFHPMDFIQVNNEINQQIIKRALSLLDIQSKETVLDLFCGLGNFTLPIARYAKHVTGIEGSKEMVARADENARLNHISNTTFYTANLMDPPKAAAWIQQQYDKILLDPPRTGAKEIIAFFPLFNAKKIVYVSCNPATFARDAKELVSAQGYTLTDIGVADMFPQTSHIEVVALFQK
ncbi:MAG TPA: 23S rRNA (uracil(1939)-C(5))-methyltransferase RlmD, partial [Gammaproteobacteria bacterium]|nr:23S rRNA (uracil(1939)-C(5))-methyltransferase RlmD [Gammaproteobacteria bacterium]